MATTTTTAQATESPLKKKFQFQSIPSALGRWIVRNKIYLIAFAIPVLLTYIAYAIFGLYPFGEESVLCLDLNGQYVYYFEAIRDAFWGDGSIWYNWARNLSGEFMGIIGYYLASPFTLIVILLPEKFLLSSLLIMQLCKIGTAGVTFSYFLQKSKGVKPLQSLFFSTGYAMMAYAIIQTIDPMWLDGVVMLPLIMLGIEYLVDDGRRLNFIIPLAIMCVANFYIAYMVCIFVAIYFLFYVFFGTEKKYKPAEIGIRFVRIGYSSIIGLGCALIMLLPVYNALKLGKFDFTDPDYSFRFQSFPLITDYCENNGLDVNTVSPILKLLYDLVDMIPQLFPAQYDSVNVQGKPEIYCGLFTVVLLPMFYMNKNITRRKKIGYSCMILLMLVCMMIVPVDMWWHGGQTPNWLPFRYSFIFSFILLSMSAMTFAKRDGLKKLHVGITAIIMAILALVMIVMKFEQMASGATYISAALMGVYLILIYFSLDPALETSKKALSFALSLTTLVMVGGEATYNAVDSMNDIDDEVAYSTRNSYQNYIANGKAVTEAMKETLGDGMYRSEKTFYRCVNDNMAFGLNGISHSSSVMNTRIINFIETLGYDTHSYYTRYDGNTALADSLLGIKYVLDRGDDSDSKRLNPSYTPVMTYDYVNENDTEKTITVYENPDALSLGYMADDDILKIDHLGNDNPFNSQNLWMSTMSGNTTFTEDGSFDTWHEYYTPLSLDDDMVINQEAITTSPYGEQTKYEVTGSGDPTVDFHLTATTSDPIYIYFKTEFQHEVNLWVSSWTEDEWAEDEAAFLATGATEYTRTDADATNPNFESLGAYFEGDNYVALRIGSFEPGTKITLRMTVANDYTIVKNFLFYSFNETLFKQDIETLKANQWDITDYSDTKITGTIEAEDGQIMMTSIPWQPGWTVRVDGKTVDNLVTETANEDGISTVSNGDGETGQIVVLNAMIGVRLTAGEHEVTLSYTPPGWWIGVGTLTAGILICVVIWFDDRKRYAALLLSIQQEEERKKKEHQKKINRLKSKKPSSNKSDNETLLKNLENLHEQGILTDAEFAAKKLELEKKNADFTPNSVSLKK